MTTLPMLCIMIDNYGNYFSISKTVKEIKLRKKLIVKPRDNSIEAILSRLLKLLIKHITVFETSLFGNGLN